MTTASINRLEFYDAFLAVEIARIETEFNYQNPGLEQGFDTYADNSFDWQFFPVYEVIFTLKSRQTLYERTRKAIEPNPIKFGGFAVPLMRFETLEKQWGYPNAQLD
jgi:hypothetical protein